MRQYRDTLRERRRTSQAIVERYWSDPEFRLVCINRDRARRGRPLLTSLDEIQAGWPQRSWADKGVAKHNGWAA